MAANLRAESTDDRVGAGDEYRLVGTAFRRVDGRAKVTGQTQFADDLDFPRMAYVKLVRSTVPHARIRNIDLSAALAMDGVLGTLVGTELPDRFGILPVSEDEHALAVDTVRFVGDPVAAVAALSEDVAHEAALAVKVDYERLPTISSFDEALATPEPRIHDYADDGNIHKKVSLKFGAVEEGFEAADVILQDTCYFEGNTHLAIEQHSAVGVPEDAGRVTVYSSTQTPHYVHRALTLVLGLPASRIRVVACSNGGGFGGKSDPFNHEMVVAKLALKLGRPCKVTLTREEVFYCHRGRHPVLMHLKTGFRKDGAITSHSICARPWTAAPSAATGWPAPTTPAPCRPRPTGSPTTGSKAPGPSPTSRPAGRSAVTVRRNRGSASKCIWTRRPTIWASTRRSCGSGIFNPPTR